MIKGTGVDIIEISRVKKAAKASNRFAARVFTDRERAYCEGKKGEWASLAARFAAKEAVLKVLGTGIGQIKWTDVEVVNGESGKPEICLHGAAGTAAAQLGVKSLALSISHCNDYAVAFVVAY